jgi:hypothetical protein
MRVGGLSASFSAKIIKEVMLLQDTGGRPMPEGYLRPCDPKVWYESFGAFKL